MNENVIEMLRRADPARDSGGYDDARVARQIAQIVRAHGIAEHEAPKPRSRARQWGVPTAAFLAVAGAGLATAAAAGWLSPGARQAFDSPAARQYLLQVYGSTADLDQARERVTAPGPDGSTMTTWTVPVAGKGTCTTILISKKSARLPGGGIDPGNVPQACEVAPAPGQRPPPQTSRGASLEWRSRKNGVDYSIITGPLAPAAGVQLRLADGTRLTATTHDGYYLLPAVPVARLTCAVLVGVDALGHQVGPVTYLTIGCPGDARQLGTPAPAAPPGSTVTEKEQTQAVAYASGVEVNVAAVIKQNPGRAAGSIAGMSLVTVRLAFGIQPGDHQSVLPTSVSFDLLYGDSHQPAVKDAGKHNDPDLSGVWIPPGMPDETNWLPQLSFDVPTDQLATLQVRINGDASHPTIVFSNVRVTE